VTVELAVSESSAVECRTRGTCQRSLIPAKVYWRMVRASYFSCKVMLLLGARLVRTPPSFWPHMAARIGMGYEETGEEGMGGIAVSDCSCGLMEGLRDGRGYFFFRESVGGVDLDEEKNGGDKD